MTKEISCVRLAESLGLRACVRRGQPHVSRGAHPRICPARSLHPVDAAEKTKNGLAAPGILLSPVNNCAVMYEKQPTPVPKSLQKRPQHRHLDQNVQILTKPVLIPVVSAGLKAKMYAPAAHNLEF